MVYPSARVLGEPKAADSNHPLSFTQGLRNASNRDTSQLELPKVLLRELQTGDRERN